MREQRAFASMAVATAATDGRDSSIEDGIEAYGYTFTQETIDDLSGLDLRTVEAPPASATMVLWRDDVTDRRSDLDHWIGRSDVIEGEATGYGRMMEPPISMSPPNRTIAAICDFVETRGSATGTAGEVRPRPEVRTEARVAPGVVERAIWYDENQRLFGVFTEPETGDPHRVLVLLNNARGYRVGPHGMNPPLARRLAKNGIATLRLDLAGVGDSPLPPGRSEHHTYGLDAVADVAAAVSYLEEYGTERVFIGGLCSGAYLAWHAAFAIPHLGGLIMLNPQLFEWSEGLSLDVSKLDLQYEANHYRRSVRSLPSWVKLLRGEVEVGRILGIVVRFLLSKTGASARRIWAGLPIPNAESEIADRIQKLDESGTTVAFVFADHDPGLTMLRQKIGGAWRGLVVRDQMRIELVEGADHSFTPGWASRQVCEAIEKILVD